MCPPDSYRGSGVPADCSDGKIGSGERNPCDDCNRDYELCNMGGVVHPLPLPMPIPEIQIEGQIQYQAPLKYQCTPGQTFAFYDVPPDFEYTCRYYLYEIDYMQRRRILPATQTGRVSVGGH